MSALLGSDGIYLKYCENNHFESVICVQHVEKNVCFDLCKVGNLPEIEYMCRKNSKSQTDMSKNSYISKNNYCFSKYNKRKLSLQKNIKYQESVLHKENKKSHEQN